MDEKTKPVSTSLAPHFNLSADMSPKNDVKTEYMSRSSYASAVGSLMYVMVCTRPDISHAVGIVSRYMHNLGKEHWQAVEWILWYIRNSVDVGLVFEKEENLRVVGYCDSDYAGLVFTGYPVVGFHNRVQASGTCLDSLEDARITSCPWDPRVKGLFFHQTTFSISLSKVKGFIEDVQRLVVLEPRSLCVLDLYDGILMRYITTSNAYLGEQEDALDFDITYYRSKDPMSPRLFEDFVEEIEQLAFFKYGALPHWGKNRNIAFIGAINKYKNADKFLKVKQSYDPLGLFSSEWTDQVLGLKDGLTIVKDGCALEGLCICSEDIHCAPKKGYFCRPGRIYKDARVCTRLSSRFSSARSIAPLAVQTLPAAVDIAMSPHHSGMLMTSDAAPPQQDGGPGTAKIRDSMNINPPEYFGSKGGNLSQHSQKFSVPAPSSASVPRPQFRDDSHDGALGSKAQGSVKSERTYPLYGECSKNHLGMCRANSNVCFGCGKPGHRIWEYRVIAHRGRDLRQQDATSGTNSGATGKTMDRRDSDGPSPTTVAMRQ
ncbi:putative L-gulonolactone oxidase 4 [Capsicum annuum]|nr:putative L-gulonolactone oxidase 4 [Capsicum annuum]